MPLPVVKDIVATDLQLALGRYTPYLREQTQIYAPPQGVEPIPFRARILTCVRLPRHTPIQRESK